MMKCHKNTLNNTSLLASLVFISYLQFCTLHVNAKLAMRRTLYEDCYATNESFPSALRLSASFHLESRRPDLIARLPGLWRQCCNKPFCLWSSCRSCQMWLGLKYQFTKCQIFMDKNALCFTLFPFSNKVRVKLMF